MSSLRFVSKTGVTRCVTGGGRGGQDGGRESGKAMKKVFSTICRFKFPHPCVFASFLLVSGGAPSFRPVFFSFSSCNYWIRATGGAGSGFSSVACFNSVSVCNLRPTRKKHTSFLRGVSWRTNDFHELYFIASIFFPDNIWLVFTNICRILSFSCRRNVTSVQGWKINMRNSNFFQNYYCAVLFQHFADFYEESDEKLI